MRQVSSTCISNKARGEPRARRAHRDAGASMAPSNTSAHSKTSILDRVWIAAALAFLTAILLVVTAWIATAGPGTWKGREVEKDGALLISNPATGMEEAGIGPGVNLAGVEPARVGGLDLSRLGIDERAGPDARVAQLLHDGGELGAGAPDVQPPLGGDLLTALGHQRHHRRARADGDLDHLVGRGHLQVQPDADDLAELSDVAVLDVPPVLPQVNRDRVGAAEVSLR